MPTQNYCLVRRTATAFLFAAVVTACAILPARAGDEWLPVTQAELQMKDFPASPGAQAIFLFREVDTDDVAGMERRYSRIKILTEEGRKRADIEIPYIKRYWVVQNLKARAIRPDGTIREFEGPLADKVLVRARGWQVLVKTFPLPDVPVGSVIEYKYEIVWDKHYVFSKPWIIPEDLFTVRVRFSRRPTRWLALRWFGSRLPGNELPAPDADGVIRFEMQNVPAFQPEDFMPPEDELKARVDFSYGWTSAVPPEKYWADAARTGGDAIGKYAARGHEIERLVAESVQGAVTPEQKLRKLYARVQRLRNLSFEHEKTEKERKREKLKSPENAESVLRIGYGDRRELDWLFLAMVKEAGIQAWPLLVAQREYSFFDPRGENPGELSGTAVLVHVDNRDLFLDPGTPFLPFGWLAWRETEVQALQMDRQIGGLISTPSTAATDSRIDRRAKLRLDDSGALEGSVEVTYLGHEAIERRLAAQDMDDPGRRQFLESEVQQWISANARVELRNAPAWSESSTSLNAQFSLQIPNWAVITGKRLLVARGVFGGAERNLFESENRTHPIYFHFPGETRDEITIELPTGYRVEAMPRGEKHDLGFLSFETAGNDRDHSIEITRRLRLGRTTIPTQVYAGVRAFYRNLRSADESQVVLQPVAVGGNEEKP